MNPTGPKPNEKESEESFNGLQLSESVLSKDWNTPEEDEAWKDL